MYSVFKPRRVQVRVTELQEHLGKNGLGNTMIVNA